MYCIDSHRPESRRHDAMRNLVAVRKMIQDLARRADRQARMLEAKFCVPLPLMIGVAAARLALSMISAAAQVARAIEIRSLAAVFRRRMPPAEAATPSGRLLAHLALTPRLLAQRPQVARARAGC